MHHYISLKCKLFAPKKNSLNYSATLLKNVRLVHCVHSMILFYFYMERREIKKEQDCVYITFPDFCGDNFLRRYIILRCLSIAMD